MNSLYYDYFLREKIVKAKDIDRLFIEITRLNIPLFGYVSVISSTLQGKL